MLKISRESEINLINVLIDNDIISGKDLVNIKKVSTEKNKSQIVAVFELNRSSYLQLSLRTICSDLEFVLGGLRF